jgi:phage tail sheath protein FI
MPNTPGVNIQSVVAVTPQTPPTTTDTAFIVVETLQGRIDEPVLCRSMTDFINNFGGRTAYSIAYDWLDAFFHEAGGGQVWVMRVTGAAATTDTFTFNDSLAAASIAVNSIGPAASGLSVMIQSGVTPLSFNIVVTGLPDGSTLTSPDLLTETDAVNWGNSQNLIRVVALGTNPPANHVVVPLAGGADNHATVTDAERVAALALMPQGLGVGQVAIPGLTTEVIQAGILNHAVTHNRFGLLDTPDTNSPTTLTGLAAVTQADSNVVVNGLRQGMMLSDWQEIPGLVPNTTRSVPPSAIVAALIARLDRSGGNPNLAAAGANGKVQYAIGKTQPDWTDAQTTQLVAAGVNPFREVYNSERFYGFRTLTNPYTDAVLIMASVVRLIMAINDQGYKIGQSVLMDQIDGNGHEAAKYGARISGVLAEYYALGALYGKTSQDAYVVDVGIDVNTPTTISNRELHAVVGIVPAPYAETVFFGLAAYSVAQGI